MASTKDYLSVLVTRAELLCFGFIRDKTSNRVVIPEDIVLSVCVKYYLQTIACFKGHRGSKIDIKQNMFRVSGKGSSKHQTYATSQWAWSRGQHEMIINVLEHNYHCVPLSIGIVANRGIDFYDSLFSRKKQRSYWFRFAALNSGFSGIYMKSPDMKSCRHKCLECMEFIDTDNCRDNKRENVMDGADIGLFVDCDEWTVRFTYNDNQIGKTVDIEPAQQYYAAIAYTTAERKSQFRDSIVRTQYILSRFQ